MARQKIERPRLKEKTGRPFRVHYRYEGDGRSFSTGTTDRAEAEKILERASAFHSLGDDPAKANPNAKPEIVNGPGSMPWEKFRERYSARFKSENLRASAAGGARSALNLVEKILQPATLGDVATGDALAKLRDALLRGEFGKRYGSKSRKEPRSPATVRSVLGTILAALRWAERNELIEKAPHVDRPKIPAGFAGKGRAPVGEELDRIRDAIPAVVGVEAAPSWRFLIEGFLLSGLRLKELLDMHWTDEQRIRPVRRGRWFISKPSDRHKGRRDSLLPCIRPMRELLDSVREAERIGLVFNPMSLNLRLGRKPKTKRPSADWISRVIGRIGKRAGVVVDSKTGKTATAHDLRRAFGQNLVNRGATIKEVAFVMDHRDRRTTERFYVELNAAKKGEELDRLFAEPEETPNETATHGDIEVDLATT